MFFRYTTMTAKASGRQQRLWRYLPCLLCTLWLALLIVGASHEPEIEVESDSAASAKGFENILDLPPEEVEDVAASAMALVNAEGTVDLTAAQKASFIHPKDLKQREKRILKTLLKSLRGNATTHLLETEGRWNDDSFDHCDWQGVLCGEPERSGPPPSNKKTGLLSEAPPIPDDAVTQLFLSHYNFTGTLPTELGMLSFLHLIDVADNDLRGTIPTQLALMSTFLEHVDFAGNQLTGPLPDELFTTVWTHLRHLDIGSNYLTGSIPTLTEGAKGVLHLDLSHNGLTGAVPSYMGLLHEARVILLADNMLSGRLPRNLWLLTNCYILDLGTNLITGTLPSRLQHLGRMMDFVLSDNLLTGTIPDTLMGMPVLHGMYLQDNALTGPIPDGGPNNEYWTRMAQLGTLRLDHNALSGSIPGTLFEGIATVLGALDFSYNHITGTIPTEIGLATHLYSIDAMSNQIVGTLPTEMLHMSMNLFLNFTDNMITGDIPRMFCGEGAETMNMLYRQFGCDAVLCAAGTFSIYGHATLHSGCRPCPVTAKGETHVIPHSKILGRVTCEGVDFVHGDLNGDGVVSAREILRMLFVDTLGRRWGDPFQSWADMSVPECSLAGVTCVTGEKVAKIDLTAANMCSDGHRGPGPVQYCIGLPAEMGMLTDLEILQIARSPHLRGTLPTELGLLSKLKFMEISNSQITSTLPSELGQLSLLSALVLSHNKLTGTIPTEILHMTRLEKLYLTNNELSGPIATSIRLENVKELMISRNELTGPLPKQLGRLVRVENIEAYSNSFNGTIPTELATCSSLKRIDIFNNDITGTVPTEMGTIVNLTIVHMKQNWLSGTIPESLGNLRALTWLDLSFNKLHGTLPSSLTRITTLKDLRLAANQFYEPIPRGLCTNPLLNNGATRKYGCDGVLCSLGSTTEIGFAVERHGGCLPCPDGQSTVFLGATSCQTFTPRDILGMFYQVMNGDAMWEEENKYGWDNDNVPVCEWSGITCDDDGEVIGLAFPLTGTDQAY